MSTDGLDYVIDTVRIFAIFVHRTCCEGKSQSGYFIYLFTEPGCEGKRIVALTDVPYLDTETTEFATPGTSNTILGVSSLHVKNSRPYQLQA